MAFPFHFPFISLSFPFHFPFISPSFHRMSGAGECQEVENRVEGLIENLRQLSIIVSDFQEDSQPAFEEKMWAVSSFRAMWGLTEVLRAAATN